MARQDARLAFPQKALFPGQKEVCLLGLESKTLTVGSRFTMLLQSLEHVSKAQSNWGITNSLKMMNIFFPRITLISTFTDWYTRPDIDDGIRLYVAIRYDPYSLDNNTNFDLRLHVDTKLYSNCNIG